MSLWTQSEVSILIENYNTVSNDTLTKLIPNKTKQGIYKKAYKLGLRKSKEAQFINCSEARKRERSSNWNGGKRTTSKGYVQILMPGHPRADKAGYVMEHILVWEKETGFSIPVGCCIHHLNENKADNRIENLCLMTNGAHTVYHHKGKHLSEETKRKISEKRVQNAQSHNNTRKIMQES